MTALDMPLAPAWHDLASCAQTDPELFFPPTGDQGHEARAICAACPVQAECLQDAIDTGDFLTGIRGGKSPQQRRALTRTRCKRCRQPLGPRKTGTGRPTEYHPDCFREHRIHQKREHNRTNTRKRKAA